MILIKAPFKKKCVAWGSPIYQTTFKPEMPYEEGNSKMNWDRVYGVWDYRPPWPYAGKTDFTRYKNVSFLPEGGMVMWVEKGQGERYNGAYMTTMRRTGELRKGWMYKRWEYDIELPNNPNVVAAVWALTETHAQEKPIWSKEFNKFEKERITPEYDWPETSTERLRDMDLPLYNVACHYGLTHYKPFAKHKDKQFPVVEGRNTWFLEHHSWGMVYGINDEVKYVQIGGTIPKKIYPIIWITVPSWAPLGFDPEGCNMKVYSFKVFNLKENE